jgi:PKD repeat protein
MNRRGSGVVLALGVCLVLLLSSLALSPGRGGSPTPDRAVAQFTFGSSVEHVAGSARAPLLGPTRLAPSTFPSAVWLNVTPPTPTAAPPGTSFGSMAYDPLDLETVYFGGCSATQCPLNQTWVLKNGHWTNITDPRDAPPARSSAEMDYDPNLPGVLLFGGAAKVGYLDDTWLFHAGLWTNLSWVGAAPPGRYGATMAFDPDPEENGSVMYGGYEGGIGYGSDTWVWRGWSGWVPVVTSIAPPGRLGASMAFDAADDCLLLFGGYESFPGYVGDTWALYGGQWWAELPASSPTNRSGAAMVYDPTLSEVLLFGGYGPTGYLGDTWSFSEGAWHEVVLPTSPIAREGAAVALDPTGSVPLLFGGAASGAGALRDSWAFEVPPSAQLAATPTTAEVNGSVTVTATVTGGTPPYEAAFGFGDGSGAFVSSGQGAIIVDHAYSAPGSYALYVNVSDSGGANTTDVRLHAVTVTSGPVIGPFVEPLEGDAGIPIEFSGIGARNGTLPYTYAWRFGDGSMAAGENASHTYAAPGDYVGLLTVTDGSGATTAARFSVLVHALPQVTISTSSVPATLGSAVAFFANLSGGYPPFRFAWRFGDGAASSSAGGSHTYSRTGAFTVELWVNDSLGGSAHTTGSVSVRASSSPGTSTGSTTLPWWFWAGLGALLIAGVAGGLLIFRRSRGPPSVTATPAREGTPRTEVGPPPPAGPDRDSAGPAATNEGSDC